MMFVKNENNHENVELLSDNQGSFVYPEPTDLAAFRELEVQRFKWNDFIKGKNDIWSESWLWSRRRKRNENNRPLQKKIFDMFNSKSRAQKQLKSLIRGGVPPELRGSVWYACSGAGEKKSSAPADQQYRSLLDRIASLEHSEIASDVEKDLLRTFPERIDPEDTATISALRRVLLAYAVRNPEVGYCQSMNYICALLLFHMEEERAFWAFSAVIEDILPPDYYVASLLGSRVDQQVFQSCIAWKLPKLHEAFRKTNTILEPIICPWFLCLYVNVLPLYTVCRIWDCLFWEGNVILFRIGLTLVRSKAKSIMAADDFIAVYSILKSSIHKEFSFEIETKEDQQESTSPHHSLMGSASFIMGKSSSSSTHSSHHHSPAHGNSPNPTHSSHTSTFASILGASAGGHRGSGRLSGRHSKVSTASTDALTTSVSSSNSSSEAIREANSLNEVHGVSGERVSGEGSESGLKLKRVNSKISLGQESSIGSESSSPVRQLGAGMSDTEVLLHSAFGYKWLRSVPISHLQMLREKFLKLLQEKEMEMAPPGQECFENPGSTAETQLNTSEPTGDPQGSAGGEGAGSSRDSSVNQPSFRLNKAKSMRIRTSNMMSRVILEQDVEALRNMALEMHEGLTHHIETFAKDLTVGEKQTGLSRHDSFERDSGEGDDFDDDDDVY